MKTAEEILGNYGITPVIQFQKYEYLYETIVKVIKEAQKEAYNQALEDKEKFAIEFATWVNSLSPADRVSVWSKDGQYKGLFNMDMEQLLEQYNKIREHGCRKES